MFDTESVAASDTAVSRVLEAAVALLRGELMPLLTDESARIRADHLTRLLRWSAAQLATRDTGMQRFVGEIIADPPMPLPANANDLAVPVQIRRDAIEAAFSASLPGLLDRLSEHKDTSIVAIETMLRAEKNYYLAMDEDIRNGSQVVYRFGRIDNEPEREPERWPIPDAASLTAYLRRRYGRQDVEARDVKNIPGGFSKLTLFFTLHDAQEAVPRLLVIRKDMPFRFMDKSVVDEFNLLRHLFANGFPVAEPLWLEQDSSLLGSPFIVFARVEGTSNVTVWGSDPARARLACEELAAAMGRLHAFAPSQLGNPETADSLSAGACLEADIKAWTLRFHTLKRETLPLLELPLLWLAGNIPAELYQRPAKVMHGDIGFHNVMVGATGHVSAILDWEFSGLGEPTQDLRFLRMFIEPMMPWDEFVQIYLRHGGTPPCANTDFFFDLWQQARNNVAGIEAQHLFDSAISDDVKFILAGHIFAPYLFIDQSERLVAHLKNIA